MSAKFKIDTSGIEISGNEEFVESQLSKFKDVIEVGFKKLLENPLPLSLTQPTTGETRLIMKTSQSQPPEDLDFVEVKHISSLNHENVFVEDSGKIQILADVPGNTVSKKMINVILIFMWAKLKSGIEVISYGDLRNACMNYGAFDSSNFSKYMDNQKKYFLILGDSRNRSAKLVRAGIKEAERLISDLNNKSN